MPNTKQPATKRDAQMASVASAVAVLGAAASVMLLLMFATEVPYNGPYVWGAGYEILTAVTSVLTAILVVNLSRRADTSRVGQLLALLLAVLLLVGAGAGILLVTHVVSYTLAVAATIVALFVQGIWLLWFNRQMHRRQMMPRVTSTFGWLIGLALTVGLPLASLGLVLPPLHVGQLLVLGGGIFVAGAAWLIMAVWWLMVAVWLGRSGRQPRAGRRSDGDGQAAATLAASDSPRQRGRRKA